MEKNKNAVHLHNVIERLVEISEGFVEEEISEHSIGRLKDEIRVHEETLRAGFLERKESGPQLREADSDGYFSEKLTALLSFVLMAVDPTQRSGYETAKVIENARHYSHLVRSLLAVPM